MSWMIFVDPKDHILKVNIFIFREVINDLGVNGQPPRTERERHERQERELKVTLTFPSKVEAGLRQG